MAYTAKQITASLKTSDGADLITGICTAEIGDISMSAEDIDVTCYGPGNTRKKMQGLIDLGTMDLVLNYKDSASTTALYNAFAGGTRLSCTLTMLDLTPNEVLTFSAYVSAFGQAQPIDGVIQTNITLTLDGTVTPYWSTISA